RLSSFTMIVDSLHAETYHPKGCLECHSAVKEALDKLEDCGWQFFLKFLFFKDFLSTSAALQTPYIKNKLMTKKCNNCEHFIRASAMNAGHVWGDCMKPGKSRWDTQGRKIPGVFTWADKSCDDFKPQNTSVEPAF
ncbi:MAG: hypothetical protein ACFFCW_40940, partial [Candidatus Hodarchaeota archaeon]